MSQRTIPPFRADHVGSLLRPKSLIDAFKSHRDGAIDDDLFTIRQDEAIRHVIRLQEDVGLHSVTDGEFRRVSYWARFVDSVDGLDVRDALFTFHNEQGHEKTFMAPHVSGTVRRSGDIAVDEFRFLRNHTSRTAKITLPSPPSMHFWCLDEAIAPGAYNDREAYFADLAEVYREEIAALAKHGATYIQLDDVPLAMLCDPAVRRRASAANFDPEELLSAYVELFNDCLGNRPNNIRVAVHLCRGNYKGHFLSEGGYAAIAETLFNQLRVDAFFLEYDSPRAGDFAPLRFVPENKIVVLGLVSSKTPELEDMDVLRRRIDEAARYIDVDQLCLSPQCGFASTFSGNPLTEDDERAKLCLVVETAERVWG